MTVNIRIAVFCDVTPCSLVVKHVSKQHTASMYGKSTNISDESSPFIFWLLWRNSRCLSTCTLHSKYHSLKTFHHPTNANNRRKILPDRLFEVELLRLRKGYFCPLTNRFKNSLKHERCSESSVIPLFATSYIGQCIFADKIILIFRMSTLRVGQLLRNIINSSDLSFQCHVLLPDTVFSTTSQQAHGHPATTVHSALILLLKTPISMSWKPE